MAKRVEGGCSSSFLWKLILVASAVCLAGCDQLDGQNAKNEKAIANLKRDVQELKKETTSLQIKLHAVSDKQVSLAFLQRRWRSAEFDPVTDQGFKRVDTSVGTLAVSVEDVQPYANGTRVQLSIGNLTSATLANATGTAKYGRSSPAVDWEHDDGALKNMTPGSRL